MRQLEVRPARADDVARFGEGLPYRARATAALLDGDVIAIGGIAFPPNGTRIAFLDIKPEGRRFPVALHKAALRVIDEARERKFRTLLAIADRNVEAAERWLERLGFTFLREVEGKRVYQWKNASYSSA